MFEWTHVWKMGRSRNLMIKFLISMMGIEGQGDFILKIDGRSIDERGVCCECSHGYRQHLICSAVLPCWTAPANSEVVFGADAKTIVEEAELEEVPCCSTFPPFLPSAWAVMPFSRVGSMRVEDADEDDR